ncbi:MAG: hypothetical protein CSA42_03905 [Gammaproteobacteria bacterium]|nr:MAG: hypothetical protein CSA42_03905 [Gammaproteobacteria bacterium]
MQTFINTRPQQRAKLLSDALRQAGLKVVNLPLLEMIAIDVSIEDKQKLQEVIKSTYDVLVVVSPTAASLGMGLMKSNHALASQTVVAVGNATAQVFADNGIDAMTPATPKGFALNHHIVNGFNNEGMLKLPCIQQLSSSSRVMVWCGQGGRKLLINSLRKRGVLVDVIELYKRQLPAKTCLSYKNWTVTTQKQTLLPQPKFVAGDKPIVLISSHEAFNNWQQLVSCNCDYQLDDFVYFVLGNRLANIIQQKKLVFRQIESLNPNHIISLL